MSENEVNLDEIYDKVLEFLNDLKPPTIHEFKEDYKIIIPFKYKFPNNETVTLNVDARLSKKWIQIKCLILLNEYLPDIAGLEERLHKEMLYANFMFAEVTYSIDKQGNIFAEADLPLDTDYNNFKSEFVSIVFAIDNFFKEIIPNVSEEIKKEDTYNSSMYT
ncbi:MAG: hypothetical protein EU549_01325 [Promethearchaeota archaeon]|nr:MAG: hypothetical protein EU549_01325 [Candidatus Lokiarchaeota archaeon]